MNSRKPEKRARRSHADSQHQTPPSARKFGVLVVVALCGLIVLFLLRGNRTSELRAPDSPVPASSNLAPNSTGQASPGFNHLKGRWLRPDGGYVLEIRSADAGGKIEAGYFNPQPIHVSRAEATRDGDTTAVFVELRDVNYPGCTYRLTFDQKRDELKGVYFQAALKQDFEVVFERMQ